MFRLALCESSRTGSPGVDDGTVYVNSGSLVTFVNVVLPLTTELAISSHLLESFAGSEHISISWNLSRPGSSMPDKAGDDEE